MNSPNDVLGALYARETAKRGFTPDPAQVEAAWTWLKADLKRSRKEHGLRKRVIREEREHVVRSESLEQAVAGASWVQESGPENRTHNRGQNK